MKKNQVDKHAARCRSCHAVTCVDCSVTFYGNDYATHLVCVSEAEKYEKTLYKAKVITKMNPQEVWIALIEEAASRSAEAPSHVRQFVLRLNDLGNVPRNKGKFINFVKNSLKMNNAATMEDIWKFLEKLKAEKDAVNAAVVAAAPAKSDKLRESVMITADVKTSSTEEDSAAKRAAKDARKAAKKKDEIAAVTDEAATEVERTEEEIAAKQARKAERKRVRESRDETADLIEKATESKKNKKNNQ